MLSLKSTVDHQDHQTDIHVQHRHHPLHTDHAHSEPRNRSFSGSVAGVADQVHLLILWCCCSLCVSVILQKVPVLSIPNTPNCCSDLKKHSSYWFLLLEKILDTLETIFIRSCQRRLWAVKKIPFQFNIWEPEARRLPAFCPAFMYFRAWTRTWKGPCERRFTRPGRYAR